MDVEEEDMGKDKDADTSINHVPGDQQEDSTVDRLGHPATTAVADAEAKKKDIRMMQPQIISWETPHTRFHDTIAIVT